MNAVLRGIWKFIKRVIISLLILIVLTGAVFSIPGVQTSLANIAVNYLKSEFGLEVQLRAADFQFPNVIHLHGVYAPDHRNDTLIYADEISFEFSGFSNNHLYAGDVSLQGGKFYMRKYEEDTLFNFMYWLDHFSSDEPVDTTSEDFKLSFDNIYISDFDYMKRPVNCDSCTLLDFYDATVMVSDFELDGSYVEANFNQLSFKDDRRFNLHEFRGKAAFKSNYMSLEDLYFVTDKSRVKGIAKLKYRDLGEFSDFLNAVVMEGQFENSVISSSEIQSYIPQYPSFDELTVNGSFKGSVNDLTATNMDVIVGSTQFFGNVHIVDCTEPSDLYLDAFIGYCQTNGADINTYVSPFIEGGLPDVLLQMSYIDLSGHYEGTLESFSTRGEIKSNLGDANVNMSFKDLGNSDIASYSGELGLMGFDLGGLLEDPTLGTITAAGQVKGVGFNAKKASAQLDLNVAEFEYKAYNYRNISIEGDVANRKFNGEFDVNDPRVKLDFDGGLDFSTDTATLDFVATIDSTDLYTTGFVGDTVSWLSGEIVADFLLYKDEWWQGQINIDSVKYRRGARLHSFNEFVLTSSNAGNITRNAIDSDILDGYIEGEYKLFQIHKPFLAALASVSSQFPYEEEPLYTDIEFNLTLKKPDIISALLARGLRVATGTSIDGRINSVNGQLSLNIDAPGIDLYGTYFDTTAIRLNGSHGRYVMNSNVRSIFNAEGLETDIIKLKADFLKDSTLIDFKGTLKDSIDSRLKFNGYMLQPTPNSVAFSWNKVRFNVGTDTLILDNANRLLIQPGRMEFAGYNFEGRTSSLSINGFISDNEYEVLRLNLHRLDLQLVNYLLRQESTEFKGQATGILILNDLFGTPSMAGNLSVDSLHLNQQHLGNLDFNLDWDVVRNKTLIDGNITLGTLETMAVSGIIAPDSTSPLLVDIDLNRFRLACFNSYLLGILDNLRGAVQGNIRLAGTFEKPTLSGELRLPNAAFSVPFLGTDYNFEGSPTIHLSSDKILLDRVPMRDTKDQTTGIASGVIYHKNLSDIKFDLAIQANRLLSLDTEEGDNNYFFGKAYASGAVRIVGPTDQMNLQIDVEAEEGTSIKLPLSSPTEIGQNDFITFVDPTVDTATTAFNFVRKGKVQDLGGLSITVNANMKPEAEVQLILDESVGGEIKGQGAGLIKINLSSSGDLAILGNYTVTQGEYLFRLQNVVSKKFQIRKGSTLNWSGDPFDAQIDLFAEYSTRTTLSGMVSAASGYGGQRVKVNLIMHLTGALMNPNISFNIEVPNVSTAWQEEIRNRLSDQDKMMDNAFSLLVANTFWNPDNSIADDLVSQPIDQMASVMSNWAAKSVFGDYADLSLNYNTYGNDAAVGSEFEVSVSKSFANDRIVVNGNVDIPLDQNTNSSQAQQQTVTGDVEVEYKITEDGRIRTKAFNRSNQNNPGLDYLSPYTQGVSVYYQADFETWDELVEKLFGHPPVEMNDSIPNAQPTLPGDTTVSDTAKGLVKFSTPDRKPSGRSSEENVDSTAVEPNP
ncbi:MAG: translocation/assembly module TamB [Bacteroidetes bacterium]|nr:MAG: translocation/assembly module TamB [Bacteroidota bacterium]